MVSYAKKDKAAYAAYADRLSLVPSGKRLGRGIKSNQFWNPKLRLSPVQLGGNHRNGKKCSVPNKERSGLHGVVDKIHGGGRRKLRHPCQVGRVVPEPLAICFGTFSDEGLVGLLVLHISVCSSCGLDWKYAAR